MAPRQITLWPLRWLAAAHFSNCVASAERQTTKTLARGCKNHDVRDTHTLESKKLLKTRKMAKSTAGIPGDLAR